MLREAGKPDRVNHREGRMDIRGLFKNAKDVKEFKAGTTVFAEGTPGDVMYVVLDGELEVRAGRKFIEVAKPGDVVGEMALIDAKARSATVVAKSDCRLVPVNERRFLILVHKTPIFALLVMRILAERLRRMTAGRRA
ncbi:MAG TPA: cyclic nucleotide-binding domain-containing protein [Burkholderiales bacterium]|nr:cyclic nucleotide-binding domain-containing protein [Burkholderiales bacterium]